MKVMLLNSGGLDSAIVAKWLNGQDVEVHSVHIDTFADNRIPTLASAQETADRYCNEHTVVTVDFGKGTTYSENGVAHSIPLSSLVVCSNGVAVARLYEVREVYTGHRNRSSETRIELINNLINESPFYVVKPHINTPVIEALTYADAASMLNVSLSDLSYTHSCPQHIPCGECAVCISRENLWA